MSSASTLLLNSETDVPIFLFLNVNQRVGHGLFGMKRLTLNIEHSLGKETILIEDYDHTETFQHIYYLLIPFLNVLKNPCFFTIAA